ncbi:brain-enriched guanylate kinase-associated protein-like isoform X2 [Liolophura sinensis]|uniref:brain-enriched guanylate kinase-associated protein-like isoform X2 n=1 Tax=Liolophura sinensis TaxID=3198878 RepID=UPI0031593B32
MKGVEKMERCLKLCACLDLHQQIEELRSQLHRSNVHISQIEHELMDSKQAAEYEVLKLRDELSKLRDRYDRLFESHKRLQRVNHSLEDKLLKVVNKYEGEKMSVQKEAASLTSKLVDAKVTICDLEEENERYRNDCNLAVQLLQCKPSNFVAHKLTALPLDLQERVKSHMTQEQIINMEDASRKLETRLIRVPMQTFPPTAMVYSINDHTNQSDEENKLANEESVPMTLIAKVLTQPEPTRKPRRTYICYKCKLDVVYLDKQVQTCGEMDRNGHVPGNIKVHRSNSNRVRLNSTETDIM